jgi:aryl-alcohol dehydrogenase-like predicted oxidoreductase
MQKILLGQTNLSVSRLGLGTVKFGRNTAVKYPEQFALPTDALISELLDMAQGLGINLLDTAPAYGVSESRLGKLLTNRDQWIISTKVGEEFVDEKSSFLFSKKHIIFSIERSLERLQTDYLDLVLVHSNGADKQIIEEEQVFATLESLKKAGKIRAFGMSTKTVAGGKLAVDLADVVMVTYNPLECVDAATIAYAHANNKGVLIKKALASGHLAPTAQPTAVANAYEFIFKEPGVSSIILGTINLEHLTNNVRIAQKILDNL